MDNVSPPHLVFSILIGLKGPKHIWPKIWNLVHVLSHWTLFLNVGIYIFPLTWADRSVLFHHMECHLTQWLVPIRSCWLSGILDPRFVTRELRQSVHTSWDITGLRVRSSTQHKSSIENKSLTTLTQTNLTSASRSAPCVSPCVLSPTAH